MTDWLTDWLTNYLTAFCSSYGRLGALEIVSPLFYNGGLHRSLQRWRTRTARTSRTWCSDTPTTAPSATSAARPPSGAGWTSTRRSVPTPSCLTSTLWRAWIGLLVTSPRSVGHDPCPRPPVSNRSTRLSLVDLLPRLLLKIPKRHLKPFG